MRNRDKTFKTVHTAQQNSLTEHQTLTDSVVAKSTNRDFEAFPIRHFSDDSQLNG